MQPINPLTAPETAVYAEFRALITGNWSLSGAYAAQERETAAAVEHARYARWLRSAPTPAEINQARTTVNETAPRSAFSPVTAAEFYGQDTGETYEGWRPVTARVTYTRDGRRYTETFNYDVTARRYADALSRDPRVSSVTVTMTP